MGGLASTVTLPGLTHLSLGFGWRELVLGIAAYFLLVALPLRASLPVVETDCPRPTPAKTPPPPRQSALLLSCCVQSLTASALVVTLVVTLADQGHDRVSAAWWAGIFGPAQIFSRLLCRWLLSRLSPAPAITGLLILQGFSALALGFGGAVGSVFGCVGLGLAHASMVLVRTEYLVRTTADHQWGRALGELARAVQLARAAGPWLIVTLIDLGSRELAHVCLGAACICAAGMVGCRLRRPFATTSPNC